jgi:hypothetical protein
MEVSFLPLCSGFARKEERDLASGLKLTIFWVINCGGTLTSVGKVGSGRVDGCFRGWPGQITRAIQEV